MICLLTSQSTILNHVRTESPLHKLQYSCVNVPFSRTQHGAARTSRFGVRCSTITPPCSSRQNEPHRSYQCRISTAIRKPAFQQDLFHTIWFRFMSLWIFVGRRLSTNIEPTPHVSWNGDAFSYETKRSSKLWQISDYREMKKLVIANIYSTGNQRFAPSFRNCSLFHNLPTLAWNTWRKICHCHLSQCTPKVIFLTSKITTCIKIFNI